MNKIMDFTVFCLESYKQAHNMTGKNALEVFNENGVFDYIRDCYNVLHSTGEEYIVEDIDIFIKSKGSKIQ